MTNIPISVAPTPPAGSRPPQSESEETDRDGAFGLGPAMFWLEEAPAWLTSGLLHLSALLLLAMLALGASREEPLLLSASLSQDFGEQLIEESLDLPAATEIELTEQVLSPDITLPEVADPLAIPPDVAITPTGESLSSDLPSVTVGNAFSGRTPGRKEAALRQFGATAETEGAVALGLEWLKRKQLTNGSWSLQGAAPNKKNKYPDGGFAENREAATGMALLAFQGAGHLPGPSRANYGRVLFRGWKWLLKQQNKDGSFFRAGGRTHRFYTHSICSIALCELLALTADDPSMDGLLGLRGGDTLRARAQAAVDYLIRNQGRLGGWKYHPGSGNSDLSVTGWAFMALKSARLAGLEVPTPVFTRIEGFLEEVARADPDGYGPKGSRYVYESTRVFNRERIPTMTSVGLLCQEYLGWRLGDQRLASGVDFLLEHPPEWRGGKIDTYYWYYASQVLLHAGGPQWPKWNNVMRKLLPANQVPKGPERGSWHSDDDAWSNSGGRLYMTCMAIYTLEVYYRHLPLYQQAAVE